MGAVFLRLDVGLFCTIPSTCLLDQLETGLFGYGRPNEAGHRVPMNRPEDEIQAMYKSNSRSFRLANPCIGGKGQRKLSIVLKSLQHLPQRSLDPLGDQMTEGKIRIRLTEIELSIICDTDTTQFLLTKIIRVREIKSKGTPEKSSRIYLKPVVSIVGYIYATTNGTKGVPLYPRNGRRVEALAFREQGKVMMAATQNTSHGRRVEASAFKREVTRGTSEKTLSEWDKLVLGKSYPR